MASLSCFIWCFTIYIHKQQEILKRNFGSAKTSLMSDLWFHWDKLLLFKNTPTKQLIFKKIAKYQISFINIIYDNDSTRISCIFCILWFLSNFMLDCVKIDANLHIFSNLTKCETTGISYLNQAFCLDLYAYPILFVCKMHGFWSCEWRC